MFQKLFSKNGIFWPVYRYVNPVWLSAGISRSLVYLILLVQIFAYINFRANLHSETKYAKINPKIRVCSKINLCAKNSEISIMKSKKKTPILTKDFEFFKNELVDPKSENSHALRRCAKINKTCAATMCENLYE